MILIISKSKRQALAISDAMFYMGHLSVGATPPEALHEISVIYKAVVIVEPDCFPDIKDYIARIRSYHKTVPLFAIGAVSSADLFDRSLHISASTPRLIAEIYEHTFENGLHVPGTYKLAGLDLSAYRPTPLYFRTELPFTRTELMILRALTVFYPTPVKAERLVKYAFRQSKLPAPGCIRTHSSIINKKYRIILGRDLITMIKGCGYSILTPELMENISKINI